ncbi:MAG: peptidylprolyl isomerase [Anaerolineales bacterium]
MPPHNKKFLAQKEKEDRQKRIIIITTISILVVVFGLIIYGVVDRYVLKPGTTIIQLESHAVKADEFEQLVKWERRGLIIEIDQILVSFQQLGGSPEIFTFFEGQLMMTVNQLDQPLSVGQAVIQNLSDQLIMLVEAEKMGIEVDDSNLDQEIQKAFGFFADGTPTPAPTLEIHPTSTLTSQQMTLVPPTVTPEVPEESEDQETPPTNTPQTEDIPEGDPDPTATPLLKPTEYTEDLFNETYKQFLLSVKSDGITEETIRRVVMMGSIQRELFNIVTADVELTQEQIWVRHILVEDEETAIEIADKLADGEDFSALAAEYSIDESNKDNGGDLGWFTRGAMVQPFEDAAFTLQIGEISDPVPTDFGWHILQALGSDTLQIDQATYEQVQNEAFGTWMEEKRLEYEPEINEDWGSFVPSEPILPQEYITFIESLSAQSQLPTPGPVE